MLVILYVGKCTGFSLVETVNIQPIVDLLCQIYEGIQGILEPMEKFFERYPIAVHSTLSLVHNGSVPVNFYNYSNQPATIYKDTSVGVPPLKTAIKEH